MIVLAPVKKNTENTMSHFCFNEESDYSEKNTCDSVCSTISLWAWTEKRAVMRAMRKKLNIITLQLPIYNIFAVNADISKMKQ